MQNSLASAHTHTQRLRRGEGGENICDMRLTMRDLKEMLSDQEWRCFYSGAVMSCGGRWKMSLERIDRKAGYFRQNCRWILRCFNTPKTQWSRELVEFFWCVWRCSFYPEWYFDITSGW